MEYATTATCLECRGEGVVEAKNLIPPLTDCTHCKGEGECACRDCIDTAAENAWSDRCESEPPVSMQEQYEAAWRQKQELRR